MLIATGDGKFAADPKDILVILFHPGTKRFHVAFFEWKPLPGEMSRETPLEVVRLRSKMHHTTGAETFEESLRHLAEMREKITLLNENVVETHVYSWNGDLPITWVARPWHGHPFQETNPGVWPETALQEARIKDELPAY